MKLARVTLQEALFMQSLIVAKSNLDREMHAHTMFALPEEMRVKPSDIFPAIWGSALRVQQGSAP